MATRPTLIVLLKQPRPGRVKTRLARGIGTVAATWWFRHQVRALLRQLRDRRWELVLSVAPDGAVAAADWPVDLRRLPQGTGDLGQRMVHAMGHARGPVCLIGGDIVGVTRGHVARAFDALRGHEVVFGPGLDGGFWLVGLRNGATPPRGLFGDVRWSTPHALADSLDGLGCTAVALADPLGDVDSAEDLARLRDDARAGNAASAR